MGRTEKAVRLVGVKFSNLLGGVMSGVVGAEPPCSASPAVPCRRQAAMALSASFLRSLRCSMLRSSHAVFLVWMIGASATGSFGSCDQERRGAICGKATDHERRAK